MLKQILIWIGLADEDHYFVREMRKAGVLK